MIIEWLEKCSRQLFYANIEITIAIENVAKVLFY